MKIYSTDSLGSGDGGFRIAWLVPIEVITYGAILTLGIKYGLIVALPLVLVPFFAVLAGVAGAKPRVSYDGERWFQDMVAAQDNGLPIPAYEGYRISVKQKSKKRATVTAAIDKAPAGNTFALST